MSNLCVLVWASPIATAPGLLVATDHHMASGLSAGAETPAVPLTLSYISLIDILETHPHDTSAFVEGLAFHESGTLYESNGHYGESYIRSLHPPTGSTARSNKLPSDLFAEGIAISGNRLLQLTYRENLMLEFILPSLTLNRTVPVVLGSEGWGMAMSPNSQTLYVTDGSDKLLHVDPQSFEVMVRVQVYLCTCGVQVVYM